MTIKYSIADQVVPGSDLAGEVIAVGQDVQDSWKIGNRVCANFAPAHLDGDPTHAIMNTALGGPSDGVLTQYKSFKPEVSFPHLAVRCAHTDANEVISGNPRTSFLRGGIYSSVSDFYRDIDQGN